MNQSRVLLKPVVVVVVATLLLLLCLAVQGTDAAPAVSYVLPDLVMRDGMTLRVEWSGITTRGPLVEITVYDTEDYTRSRRFFGTNEMRYASVMITDMAVTASAAVKVCNMPNEQSLVCAVASPYFSIHEALE